MSKTKEPKGEYKFNEKEYVEELLRVIDSTYTGHYSRDHFPVSYTHLTLPTKRIV